MKPKPVVVIGAGLFGLQNLLSNTNAPHIGQIEDACRQSVFRYSSTACFSGSDSAFGNL